MEISLPFLIGKDYEFWEFQLEIKEDKLKYYDSYRYLGTVDIFSLVTNHVELIFNYDSNFCDSEKIDFYLSTNPFDLSTNHFTFI